MQDEKKLVVYEKSLQLAQEVYRLTFPHEETYGLQSQIRRAATSISLNIAEGTGRFTQNDFKHFLVQARGSAKEVVTALELSKRLGFISSEQHQRVTEIAESVAKMLSALITKIGERNDGRKNSLPPTTN
ncbi:MAG: four helix bundle protein [Nanoarchaeota archaeon]|nr:four helix bundle protein [Nanoarchaeota archaeon]